MGLKFAPLVWASLSRRLTRTIFVLASIVTAFLLFGMLDAVRVSFAHAGDSSDGARRLNTASRLSLGQPLPNHLGPQIAAIPGVEHVTYASWFGGSYRTSRNVLFSVAVAPNYFDVYKEISLGMAERKAFNETRTGAIVGATLASRFQWKVGDKVPLQSPAFPDRRGSKDWTFDIVGIMHSTDKEMSSFVNQQFAFNWKYFDETTPYNGGTAGWYVTRISSVDQSSRIAVAIDNLSENTDHETTTQTEHAATVGIVRQFADIGLIVTGIMIAVFFTLLLLTGNTMMQAARERTAELGVLKTIGFSNVTLMAMLIAESVLLLVVGGCIGLAGATAGVAMLANATGGLLPLRGVGAETWAIGAALMSALGILVGAFPGLKALRLDPVAALAVH